MTCEDNDGDVVYYNQTAVLSKPVLTIYRVNEDDIIVTKVVYTEGGVRTLYIDDDAHGELCEVAERMEKRE